MNAHEWAGLLFLAVATLISGCAAIAFVVFAINFPIVVALLSVALACLIGLVYEWRVKQWSKES